MVSGTAMPYVKSDSSMDGSRVVSRGGISELVSGRGYWVWRSADSRHVRWSRDWRDSGREWKISEAM